MNLRPELCPPVLDPELVKRLAVLAEELDGCQPTFQPCTRLLAEFNRLAGTELEPGDFHFSGAVDAMTFVSDILLPAPAKLEDVTYEELLELVRRVCEAEGSEVEIRYWLEFLAVNIPNPNIFDLIFYPETYLGSNPDHELTPQEILVIARQPNPPKRVFYL